jgi:FtsP/CotA-like multicopper oxidase with cupredoxin domain
MNGSGGAGLILVTSQRFRVDLTNKLDVETLIHWHGQIPPNVQDGVPDMPMPTRARGEIRSYDFAPRPGTNWTHSHIPVQEVQLPAAPLILRRADDMVIKPRFSVRDTKPSGTLLSPPTQARLAIACPYRPP